MNYVEKRLQELITLLTDQLEDGKKFDLGNRAAGVRIRKNMQEVREKAKNIRTLVADLEKMTDEERGF